MDQEDITAEYFPRPIFPSRLDDGESDAGTFVQMFCGVAGDCATANDRNFFEVRRALAARAHNFKPQVSRASSISFCTVILGWPVAWWSGNSGSGAMITQ